jgi:hypothetical protein
LLSGHPSNRLPPGKRRLAMLAMGWFAVVLGVLATTLLASASADCLTD